MLRGFLLEGFLLHVCEGDVFVCSGGFFCVFFCLLGCLVLFSKTPRTLGECLGFKRESLLRI